LIDSAVARRARWRRACLLSAALIMAASPSAFAAGKQPPATPLPRFESLRWDKVNLRAGPGDQYPIRWVLTRKGMPVEILERFDVWRKIRDWQGSVGWVHERMLVGNRTVMVLGARRTLHADPSEGARPVARADAGVVGRLLSCHGDWCRIDAQGVTGWLERGQIFGVTPDETVE
jgi:SH3-like domain-containing protein